MALYDQAKRKQHDGPGRIIYYYSPLFTTIDHLTLASHTKERANGTKHVKRVQTKSHTGSGGLNEG